MGGGKTGGEGRRKRKKVTRTHYRVFFSGGTFFFGRIFSSVEIVWTDLRSTRSVVETDTKSERASQRGQENGRERRYNKFYLLTGEKQFTQTTTPTTTSHYM